MPACVCVWLLFMRRFTPGALPAWRLVIQTGRCSTPEGHAGGLASAASSRERTQFRAKLGAVALAGLVAAAAAVVGSRTARALSCLGQSRPPCSVYKHRICAITPRRLENAAAPRLPARQFGAQHSRYTPPRSKGMADEAPRTVAVVVNVRMTILASSRAFGAPLPT